MGGAGGRKRALLCVKGEGCVWPQGMESDFLLANAGLSPLLLSSSSPAAAPHLLSDRKTQRPVLCHLLAV